MSGEFSPRGRLEITATLEPIDGVSGVLGSAGPTSTWNNCDLPPTGRMRFDIADVDGMEADGIFQTVIEHEMAHVIGYG